MTRFGWLHSWCFCGPRVGVNTATLRGGRPFMKSRGPVIPQLISAGSAEVEAASMSAKNVSPNTNEIDQTSTDAIFADKRERGVTRRVVLLCLALAFFFGYIISIIDVKLQNSFLGAQHLPAGAIAVLLVLLLYNPLLRVVSKKLAFARNEMLTIYMSCLFSCLVPGHGAENYFVPNIIGVFYSKQRDIGYT